METRRPNTSTKVATRRSTKPATAPSPLPEAMNGKASPAKAAAMCPGSCRPAGGSSMFAMSWASA